MERILVVGAGTMGSGIAQAIAEGGRQALLADAIPGAAEKAKGRIAVSLDKAIAKGKITPDVKEAVLGRITALGDFKEIAAGTVVDAAVDLVIEAITENAAVKKELFSELDKVLGPQAIFASNTSALSVTELARATSRPERFIGMHFFNPAPIMKLVEIIRGADTAEGTFEAVRVLAEQLGKTPVTVNEAPGFVVNRLLVPMINEAVYALMEGVASAEDIDTAMKLGAGHPMGPLALADMIGLDVCLAIMEALDAEFGDPKYRPCPLLRKMVRAGRLGRKSGRGFFDYHQ
ncbi:MAG TPA: 3-hydroxybutyryl-CoA dehydrogenase [Firmicutes bacterium]|nr:3-hydroxybutyryl-CoA dehydrogenase [Bacillota bacterium]